MNLKAVFMNKSRLIPARRPLMGLAAPGLVGLVLTLPAAALAQERPLSVPDRPPVPLTDSGLPRAGSTEPAKSEVKRAETPASPAAASAPKILVPPIHSTRHFTTGNPALDLIVNEAASLYGLDPCLIIALMRQESGFNSKAVSYKGASGLMQLMPATATRFGVKNIFDVRENVMGGTKYLRWLLDRYGGDVRLALAGYNAGEGAVEMYGYRIPPYAETINYVRLIYSRYSAAHAGPAAAERAAEPAAKKEQPSSAAPSHNQIIRFSDGSNENKP
jgi:soluble lytic murein transglycosylase-like protein